MFQSLKFISFWVAIFFSCSKTEEVIKEDPNQFALDKVKVYTVAKTLLTADMTTVGNNIDLSVENDGLPGSNFIVEFSYLNAKAPISVTPDIQKAINFSQTVTFEIQFSALTKKTYFVTIKEKPANTANFFVERIDVETESGSASDVKLSQSGNDFIGLTTNASNNQLYKLKPVFPFKIAPVSIMPDLNVARDYSKGVTFDVTYPDAVVKSYTVKISNYKTSDFKREVIRGVWVSDIASDVYDSPANIKQCIDLCAEIGINTVFVVVYNNAVTKYKSPVMQEYMGTEIDPKYAGRDPLREMIDAAKPKGIKVVAWYEYGFASVYGDASGGALIKKYPQWASKDIAGKITEKNSFYWLDAYNPEVQRFIKRLMTEVLERYPDIHGVQGDDRLPALPSNGGYNPEIVARYKSETGKDAPANVLDAQWLKWRADKLSDFGEYIFRHVKTMGGKYMVSWSPSPYNWSLENYLQDSPEWLRRNIVDHLHPQLYRSTFESYKTTFDQAIVNLGNIPQKELIFSPGIIIGTGGSETITPEILDRKMAYNRSQGIQGETFFYFERIKKNKGYQDVIKKYNK
jgi:uncharacterized lipoprotein YddW (UPF0748 family)